MHFFKYCPNVRRRKKIYSLVDNLKIYMEKLLGMTVNSLFNEVMQVLFCKELANLLNINVIFIKYIWSLSSFQ